VGSIAVQLEKALAELRLVAGAYGEALLIAARRVAEARAAEEVLTMNEDALRDRAYRDGLPGSNEGARAAHLKMLLHLDANVSERRWQAEETVKARDQETAAARGLDVRQKALRAEVVALTALLMGEGR
jgi:hypothetical protein